MPAFLFVGYEKSQTLIYNRIENAANRRRAMGPFLNIR